MPIPLPPSTTTCKPMVGDVTGDMRVLMKVNTAELLTPEEAVKLDKFADSVRGTRESQSPWPCQYRRTGRFQ